MLLRYSVLLIIPLGVLFNTLVKKFVSELGVYMGLRETFTG